VNASLHMSPPEATELEATQSVSSETQSDAKDSNQQSAAR
jgi:hypothetical protein